jgi:hypothetical protein
VHGGPGDAQPSPQRLTRKGPCTRARGQLGSERDPPRLAFTQQTIGGNAVEKPFWKRLHLLFCITR